MSDSLEITDVYSEEQYANPSGFSFLRNLDLDSDVIRRLSMHLQGVREGNSEVYSTPMSKSHSAESVLSGWDSIFNSKSSLMNNTLYDLEQSNRSKFGPRSIALPWKDRIAGVSSYYEGRSRLFSRAKPTPLNGLKNKGSLRPISLDESVKLLKNNTNSGLPFYTRKSKVKDRLVKNFNELLKRKDPCILFTRTQESQKTRTVWGFPVADTLNEMRFYKPILDYQKRLSWRAALRGPNEVDKHVTEIISRAKFNDMNIISIDFSSFDSSVSDSLIDESFKYISSLFQSSYHDEISYIKERFNTIGLVTPDGVLSGNHGVPSGSTFTNEVDSIVQYLVAHSLFDFIDGDFQIQGDDGVYLVTPSNMEEFFRGFTDSGLNINREKSYVSEDYCIYLQNLYHNDYRDNRGLIGGIYPTYRALNRLFYQERWSNFEDFGLSGKDYYSIRAISILENCKHHPLHRDLVKYIFELDKYSLEYSKIGLDAYCNMLLNGPGTGGVINNQYGDDVKGISSFKTIEVIKSFA